MEILEDVSTLGQMLEEAPLLPPIWHHFIICMLIAKA